MNAGGNTGTKALLGSRTQPSCDRVGKRERWSDTYRFRDKHGTRAASSAARRQIYRGCHAPRAISTESKQNGGMNERVFIDRGDPGAELRALSFPMEPNPDMDSEAVVRALIGGLQHNDLAGTNTGEIL